MFVRPSGLVGTRAVGALAEVGREAPGLCWLAIVSIKTMFITIISASHRKCTHGMASRQKRCNVSKEALFHIYISEHRHYIPAHWKLDYSSNFQFFLEIGVNMTWSLSANFY